MRQKLFIFLTLIGLVVILIGLNAATYVQKQKWPDSEFMPNRSTYNPGTTGTQAFYSLLSETGRKVVRWQEPPDALRTARKNKPKVFVVIGSLKRQFTEVEAVDLYQWVSEGGRLVIIDREPGDELIRDTTNWKIHFLPANDDGLYGVDPAGPKPDNQVSPRPNRCSRRPLFRRSTPFSPPGSRRRWALRGLTQPRTGEPDGSRSPGRLPPRAPPTRKRRGK